MSNLINILSVLMLLFGACKQNANTQVNSSINLQPGIIKVDLDTCNNERVNFDKIFITHKNFDKVGDTDTLRITDNLISVKTSEYIIGNDETKICLSRLEVFYKNQRVFYKDSIPTTGMFYYEKDKGLLTIPVILNQNSDNLSTETALYVCDLNNGKIKPIENILINSSFALICCNGTTLLYNNGDKLLTYNLGNDKKQAICNFDNPLLSVFKLSIKGEYLDIYYFKDFANDIANDIPMNKAKIKIPKEICGN
jgi:hypothetical protein